MFLVFLTICLLASPCLAKPHWQYVETDGLNVMIAPADEMGRMERFKANYDNPNLHNDVIDKGGLKILDKMQKTACAGWWAIAIYLPPEQWADFQKGAAKVIMTGVHKQDTITVESEEILFAYGWGLEGNSAALNQRSPMSTSKISIQVRCSRDPNLNDLEWMIFDKDNQYYVIGWVPFSWEKVKKLEPIGFRLAGVSVYQRGGGS